MQVSIHFNLNDSLEFLKAIGRNLGKGLSEELISELRMGEAKVRKCEIKSYKQQKAQDSWELE